MVISRPQRDISNIIKQNVLDSTLVMPVDGDTEIGEYIWRGPSINTKMDLSPKLLQENVSSRLIKTVIVSNTQKRV